VRALPCPYPAVALLGQEAALRGQPLTRTEPIQKSSPAAPDLGLYLLGTFVTFPNGPGVPRGRLYGGPRRSPRNAKP
jgi:hypothetical protein